MTIWAIYLLNVLAAIYSMPKIIFFSISFILILNLVIKNSSSFPYIKVETLLTLMIVFIPLSFRSVFGTEFSEFPVSFYHIFNVFFILKLLSIRIRGDFFYDGLMLIFLFLFIILFFNFMIKTNYFNVSFNELFTYLFHFAPIYLFYANKSRITYIDHMEEKFLKFYIIGGIFSSLGIIFQYLVFRITGNKLFFFQVFGSSRYYLGFLFYDMSLMTLYLASVLIVNDSYELYNKNITRMVIVLSMALSSARTGLFVYLTSIIFSYVNKIFIQKKATLSEFFERVIMFFLFIFAFLIFNRNRYQGNLNFEKILDNNGRYQGYLAGIEYFKKNPILGSGLDFSYKSRYIDNNIIPHSYFIYTLDQLGILGWIPSILVHSIILLRSKNTLSLKIFFYVFLLGSNLVPSFLSGRFFTILVLIILYLDVEN